MKSVGAAVRLKSTFLTSKPNAHRRSASEDAHGDRRRAPSCGAHVVTIVRRSSQRQWSLPPRRMSLPIIQHNIRLRFRA